MFDLRFMSNMYKYFSGKAEGNPRCTDQCSLVVVDTPLYAPTQTFLSMCC